MSCNYVYRHDGERQAVARLPRFSNRPVVAWASVIVAAIWQLKRYPFPSDVLQHGTASLFKTRKTLEIARLINPTRGQCCMEDESTRADVACSFPCEDLQTR